MAATHCVALFLPNTVAFHDKRDERRTSGQAPSETLPAEAAPAATPAIAQVSNAIEVPLAEKRATSMIDLPTRGSSNSLFSGTPPPTTPSTASLFTPVPAEQRSIAKPGDPRSHFRSDAEAPGWGTEPLLNQPRSKAGPVPSGSILDFAKTQEDLNNKRHAQATKPIATTKSVTTSPPHTHGRKNRLPSNEREFEEEVWTVEGGIQGNGGLINSYRSASNNGELELSWIGTLGFPTDSLPEATKESIEDHLLNEYQSTVVYVADKDFDGAYTHYCKTILWPIFHYQVPDHPKSKAYEDHSWHFYRTLNEIFAQKVVNAYKRGDTIWIHDYHLLLVPGLVRKKLPDAKIGFFLHTAFPSSEVFRCLATRNELLEGMLGANLVAFQTEEYAQHFLQTCSRLLTVETTAEGVQLEDHFVNVTNEPIGINPTAVKETRDEEVTAEWIEALQHRFKDKLVIVARDKLDNVHGVRQKLLAYELFLNKYPEWREKVVLVQVAMSTSENSELLTTVSDICTRIDNSFSSLVNQPLVFLKQDIDFAQYLALLTIADVMVISALRDGMALSAHEYIFCQDGLGGPKKYGPLILSEFTGSAAMFDQGPDSPTYLSINPWDYHGQADALRDALVMPMEERKQRWEKLHKVVMKHTGGYWATAMIKSLSRVYELHHQRAPTSVPRLSHPLISEKYKIAKRRLFLIDYEGTLAPHKTSSGIPLTSPHRIIDTLNDMMADSKNVVYVMSGRKPEDMENVFRTASGVGLIAENGCFVRAYGAASSKSWVSHVDLEDVQAWKDDVFPILDYYRQRMEGSLIEERRCSLIFRYDKYEDQEAAVRNAGDCADQINSSCKDMGIHAVPIHKAVLVEQTDFSKGTAAMSIYEDLAAKLDAQPNDKALDFMMVAGDDREDEIVYRWANGLCRHGSIGHCFTISVGKRNTEAQAALAQGSTGLLTVLQKLAKISLDGNPVDYFNSTRHGNTSRRAR